MLTTDLLPEAEKKLIRLEVFRRLISFFTTLVVVVCISIASFLASLSFSVFFSLNELERSLEIEKTASEQMKVNGILEKASALTLTLNSIKDVLSHSQGVSATVESILRDAVQISVISLTLNSNGNVVLQGFARTRNELLGFEQKLRESGHFQEIMFPLSSIVREYNINFTMRAVLKASRN